MPHLFAQLHRRFGEPSGLTRRQMIERSLAAAAGLLLSDRFTASPSARAKGRVAIVGAGFSGLAAGFELSRAGYEVTVLEARNRVGGRVLSFSDLVPGKNVEGGAELVGSNHPFWMAYATRFGLEFLDVTEEEDLDAPIVLGGRRLAADEAEALWEEMDGALAAMTADAARVDPHTPWTSPDAEARDHRTLASWIEAVDASPLCRSAIHTMMTADNGVVADWQSYLANLAMVSGGGFERFWTDSEVYRCRGGNQQLARTLAEALGDRVRTRTIVRALEVRDDGVRVSLDGGAVLEADHVVLTAPPPVWNRIAFEPSLPPGLVPQMGSNVKFLMAFKDAFWRRDGIAPDLLSDGPISLTWHGTDGQAGRGDAIVAFSGGPAADTCREWTAEARTERYLSELQAVYPRVRRSFVRARFMDWPSDPWVKASYSFPAPGQVTAQGPTFHAGLGRLQFAGEYCSYGFMGYMEGALQTGAAAARRIAVRDGLASDQAA